jgi:hypothetical protein
MIRNGGRPARVVNTEGATDRQRYADLVGMSPEDVMAPTRTARR